MAGGTGDLPVSSHPCYVPGNCRVPYMVQSTSTEHNRYGRLRLNSFNDYAQYQACEGNAFIRSLTTLSALANCIRVMFFIAAGA